MSSPRAPRSPRTPRSPQTPRRASSRTPSSRLGTPSRRRVAGTSERDVIPASDGNVTPRRSQQAPSSPFHNGLYILFVHPTFYRFVYQTLFSSGISEIDLSSPMNYGTPSSVGSTRSTRSGGIRGTPVRPRLDVRQERRARSLSLIPENVSIKMLMLFHFSILT